MRIFIVTSIVIIIIGTASMTLTDRLPNSKIADKVQSAYLNEIAAFEKCLDSYTKYFYDSGYNARKLKYEELVFRFKRIECLFVYTQPELAYNTFLKTAQFEIRDFGPPFPDNWLILGPFGIDSDSVINSWPKSDLDFSSQFIRRASVNFSSTLQNIKKVAGQQLLTEEDIFEALRLQMVRISTIGIGNGDFIIETAGMPALKGAFSAWADMFEIAASELNDSESALKNAIFRKVKQARSYLDNQQDFYAFDRLHFLKEYLIPLSQHLRSVQTTLRIDRKIKFGPMKQQAAHVYEEDAFNPDYFAPGNEAYLSEAKADLGMLLFFDPLLSGNNERACASCHKPEMAFTDGNIKSMNFERKDLPRNAPTVINAGFQKSQFWDLRASSLEDQLDSVVNSPDELHSSFTDVAGRLSSSKQYVQLFNKAFPETKKTGIQRKHIKIAIASYERTLTGQRTRFDDYVNGRSTALTESEKNGFNVFMGKAKCGTCHYAPLFAAALPPYFDFTDHRSIGVPLKDSMKVYEVDTDTGFSKVSRNPLQHFSFKVPTVRNVALTAPYMHNGVFRTLEQVVDFYNEAGGEKFIKDMRPGMKGLPFFMILPEKLNLTDKEKSDLVAFMKSLTDTTSAKKVPSQLPVVTGKYKHLNNRKLGGIY